MKSSKPTLTPLADKLTGEWLTGAYLPESYKWLQRLVNALIKFLLVVEKDTGIDFSAERAEMLYIVNRYSLKNLKTSKEHTDGLSSLKKEAHLGISALEQAWTAVILSSATDNRLAMYAVHNKYYVYKDNGCYCWPRELGDIPTFSDKQIIKAINCLRSKKDSIFA